MEKPFLAVGNTAMNNKASVLGATHTKTLHAGGGECASSFIPQFCADKLGRRINTKSSYLNQKVML